MRSSYPIQDFTSVAKRIFVQIAEEELKNAGEKVNVSRISVITGVYRDEARRILDSPPEPPSEASLLARVITQWRHDKRFRTSSGKPRVLSYRGSENQFKELVESVSKNINPGTVLFELKRLGAVEKTKKGIRLKWQVFGTDSDPSERFELLSRDWSTLLDAVTENATLNPIIPNLHIRTEFDNISKCHLAEIRIWLIEEGKRFHRRVRDYLSGYDLDITPELALTPEEAGGRVTVGTFSFSTEPDEKLAEKAKQEYLRAGQNS
ncbi:MAG: hypothetical protein D6719_04320 [Candidatus Dadabacteria bacterium]|nr:MAG: hypothetical protein D6719_04320 [Candidatus Dadabacteria bacterium]